MFALVGFHLFIIVLGLGIVTRFVPLESVSSALSYVHKTIGITTPRAEQTRTIALVWLGALLIIVDGCLLLLAFITFSLK